MVSDDDRKTSQLAFPFVPSQMFAVMAENQLKIKRIVIVPLVFLLVCRFTG